jgi:CDP-ribitol ribitolphosphotransferase / teichoic acid ribitol-phosphate polymerase
MESFLAETLDSLVNQTFTDFEVIIVNDGSTDKTQDIIDKYCSTYPNFKYIIQKNLGASSAKNRGIKEAQGDYLVFLDGDDKFTPIALEKLFYYANKMDADLVIGRTKIFNLFKSRYLKSTVNLSKTKEIEPFNMTLIWSFSQSNKLFSRKKILEMNLKFPNKKYAEDGLFVLNFAHHCDKIVGCPYDILLYRKRLFEEGYSATQTVTKEMLEDYIESYNQIYDMSKKNFKDRYCNIIKHSGEQRDLIIKYYEYLEKIRYKEAKLLLDQFYRLFWRMDDDNIKCIKDVLFSIKQDLFPHSWKRLSNECIDLNINELINNKIDMAENPLVSVAIFCKSIDLKKLKKMLMNIYHQDLPAFEILIDNHFEKLISNEFKYGNLHFLDAKDMASFKNLAVLKAKGDYIIFFDDYYVLDPEMFKSMFNQLDNSEFEFVSVKINSIRQNKILKYPSQELVYSNENTSKNKSDLLVDLYFSNKMIKVEYLRDNISFTNDPAYDIKNLYDHAKFKIVPGNFIFINKREKDLIKLSYSKKISLALKSKYLYFKLKLHYLPFIKQFT